MARRSAHLAAQIGLLSAPVLAVVDEGEMQGLGCRMLQRREGLRHTGERADAGTCLLPAIRCAYMPRHIEALNATAKLLSTYYTLQRSMPQLGWHHRQASPVGLASRA